MRVKSFRFLTVLATSLAMLSLPLNAFAQQRDDRNYNEDEWYDPTDWFDGNNQEYDDTYDDEYRQQDRRGQRQTRSNQRNSTQRRYSSDASQQRNIDMSGQAFIEQHDLNDDGKLTRNEMPEGMRQTFRQIDRNNDNYLTRQELQQHARGQSTQSQPVHIAYIWVTDANQGQMSLEDLQQAYDLLQQVDNDGNGQISRRELRARRQEIISNWVDSTFRRHDENDDGRINRDEANATAMAQRFEQLDRNGDDRISRDELQRSLEEKLLGQGSGNQGQGQNRSQQRQSNRDQDQSQRQQDSRNRQRQQD